MKSVIRIFVFFFLLCVAGNAVAQDAVIKEAEVAYNKEDYATAIELYEGLLENNGKSAAIYYNLGNSYYKSGKIASAILNYERALLMSPADSDIRFNLQLAKQMTVDKIEPLGEFFLVKWYHSIQNMASADAWGRTGVICFLVFLVSLAFFFFSKQRLIKQVGFYSGLFFLFMTVVSNVFGSGQKSELKNRSEAIVFTPTVTVKSSPDNSGTDLFVIHEGTKVSVKSTLGEWSEISLEDGNVGWMPSKDIVKI